MGLGCRKKEGKKEGKKGEKKREGEREADDAMEPRFMGFSVALGSPSLFHTLVFKILAQWSFFNEFAPVVAINSSVMVLKQVVISCPIEHLARVGWTSN